ncbi:MAG: hypothetical protein EP349_05370 [Alphaproteobacteria bacterium]|nr:MAG: hypothetical protein EP349_05370 [Alphaproteobacteria bacterium]
MVTTVFSVLTAAAFIATLVCAALAALSDLRGMRIANLLSLVITGSFAFAFLVDLAVLRETALFGTWWHAPLAGLLMLVITFIMTGAGIIGGGDSKLASSLALWTGLSGMPSFLLVMSFSGGILAFIAIAGRDSRIAKALAPRCGEKSWIAALAAGKNALPYGVAIFLGAVAAFLQTGLFTAIFITPFVT